MAIHYDFITAFLTKWERRKLQGYVPCRPGGNYIGSGSYVGCEPIMSSGVTIGTGVDLGQQTEAYLTSIGIPAELVDKLRPYLRKRRHDALEALYQKPLYITDAECDALDTAVHADYTERVAKLYDSRSVIPFSKIPRNAQAAIVSLFYHKGDPKSYPKTWEALITQDWKTASAKLRNGSLWKGPFDARRADEGLLLAQLGD